VEKRQVLPANDNRGARVPAISDISPYKLSRVFAEGWNAARKLSSTVCDGLNGDGIAALNPYASEPARSRWTEGFTKAWDD
jgi:hypothetical protein